MNKVPRVMIVDDEHDVLATYADMLRSGGYDVYVADHAAAALAVAQAIKPDVALVDQRMPKVGGLELASALASLVEPPPRVILFTALPTVDLGKAPDDAPFHYVLFKPVSLSTLLRTVEREADEARRRPA